MFLYGLRHRWFPKKTIGAMKNWVEDNRDSREQSYCLLEHVSSSAYGDGVLITSSDSEGISAASVLYQHLGRPVNLVYCSKENENTVWFVVAKDGIIYGDHIIKLTENDNAAQPHAVNKLIQDIERFKFCNGTFDQTVTIFCNDVIQDHDEASIVLAGLFKFDAPYVVDIQRTDFDINIVAAETPLSKQFGLSLSTTAKFPVDERFIKVGVSAAILLAVVIIIGSFPEKKAPAPVVINYTPVVVDTYKKLKAILTEGDKAVGIKQRFGFIVNELNVARKIKGYDLESYTANQEASSMNLKRTFGTINKVKSVLPETAFYYQQVTGGLKLVRVTPKFPVFKTAVRANTYAEKAWIESALRYVWPEHIGEIKVKALVKKQISDKYTEFDYTIPFEGLYLEDLESMSSLFVGRSASFEELNFTVDEKDKSYNGELKIKIIGVPDENFGIKKR